MNLSKKLSADARKVAKELLSLRAVEFNVDNPFIWVSGIKSPIYCDNRKIVSDVSVRTKMVDFFCDFIKKEFPQVDIIAGVATGGIPMGVLIADKLNLPFIYVRQAPKEHGLMKQVEGSYNPGDKVVLIEDHVSTGGSSLKAINGLKKEKLDLLGLISIMTYGFQEATELFESEHINHLSLCDLETIIDVATDLGIITEENKNSIFSFKNDPKNWANR